MKARELLLECKIAKGVTTDYELADALQIPRARISDYMSGKLRPNEYACFRIAEALGREPSEVIAEIKVETDPKHAEFWRDFLQRRGLLGLGVGVSLLSCSLFCAPDASAADLLSHAHNEKLRKRAQTRLTARKAAGRRFFYGRKKSIFVHLSRAYNEGLTPETAC